MFTLANIRRCYPCIVILAVMGLAQFYIFAMNDPLAGYMRNTFYSIFSKKAKQSPVVAHAKSIGKSGPSHVLLVSYARTGGAFIGDLLQSHPDVLYYFEPLHFFGGELMTKNIPEAKVMLKRLFQCQSSMIPGYMDWHEIFKSYMKLQRSHSYWEECAKNGSCFSPKFLDSFCSEKSKIVIRTSRMTLREASSLYDDFPDLNLKIIYLSRDPRATMNSRTRPVVRDWCKDFKSCYNPVEFCSILHNDLDVACKLLRERPGDFMVLRYEDVCREPYESAQALSSHLNYNGTGDMMQFLGRHTVAFVDRAGDDLHFTYNTYRNSQMAYKMWRGEINYEDAVLVQNTCKSVLDGYGYHSYNSSDAMRADQYLDRDLAPSIENYCKLIL